MFARILNEDFEKEREMEKTGLDDTPTGTATSKRTFGSGATRDTEEGKYDYEAFLSPQVSERYAEYLHKHRKMADGSLRDGDNWQKGIPKEVYMKSAWRHFMSWWSIHRRRDITGNKDFELLEEALCAVLFNVSGYLHEHLKQK